MTGEANRYRDFWNDRAARFSNEDAEGWAAVCHRGAPEYFNRYIDWAQRQAVGRLLDGASFAPGDAAVDVGCGTGRWTRELRARGLSAAGYDFAPEMVARARELAPDIPFDVAPADAIPVADGSQQIATTITVLHHLPFDAQKAALAELARIVRPGGYCVALVLIDTVPSGAWCYPRSRRDWRTMFEHAGFRTRDEVGEEYLTPGLALHLAAGAVHRLFRGVTRAGDAGAGSGRGPLSRTYRALHRGAVAVSYPLESAAARAWPGAPATAVGLLLERV